MSGSGRKHISKWDLKEVPQPSLGDVQYNDWPGKAGKFIHNKESQPGWRSPEIAGRNDPKWYGVEGNNKDGREFSNATMAWDEDRSYSPKMYPGLDDWRRNRCRSPKSGWGRSYRSRSRSRSRTPSHGFNRESGLNDRSIVAQPCKDFAAGRCRRGDHCQYLHQDDRDYEDRRYSESSLMDSWESRHGRSEASKYSTSDDTREPPLRIGRSNDLCNDYFKGKCRRGASCKYAHYTAASDGSSKGSTHEVFRERENDRRNKDASFEQSWEHKPCRRRDIPCKFFAAGNCRNGKFCRFSHHGQTRTSPDDRSRDDWRRNHSDNVDQSKEGLKWSDTTASDVAKLQEWSEDRSGDIGAPEQRATAWSTDDRWEHTFINESRSWDHPMESGKAVDSNEGKYLQLEENTGVGMGVSESRGCENWLGDMEISPEWNYRVQSPHHIVKEHGHSRSLTLNGTPLPTCEQDITQEALFQKHHAARAMQPVISENYCFQSNPSLKEDASDAFSCDDRTASRDSTTSLIDLNFSANVLPGQSLDQNGHCSSAVTQPFPSSNAVGQNQQTFPLYASRGESITNSQSQQLFQEDKSFNKSDIGNANRSEVISEIPPTQNIVSREQLSQLTNLSASLAQLLGNGQQLPQLYAALNPQNSMEFVRSSLPNSAELVASLAASLVAASSQPNPATGFQKQYDPISGSIEPTKPDINNPVLGFSTNSIEEKSLEDGKPEILSKNLFLPSVSGGPSGADPYKTGNLDVDLNRESHQLNQPDLVANCEGEGNNGTAEETESAQDNGPSDKMDGDGRADEGKKNNDVKGIRAFKFALVDFIKELLKPTWKEGQISKETHNAIVKKVVDKVTGSIQGAHIPQSQEKIDNYMSCSKPKLTKLVQAYVEKYQKS
uniref:Putative zinc finger CCCH domain-containing protein 38 isoform X1 n=1 Tax=Davidia involucrata TaxID=16924 RepID=A0A5B7BHS1_DAVIN